MLQHQSADILPEKEEINIQKDLFKYVNQKFDQKFEEMEKKYDEMEKKYEQMIKQMKLEYESQMKKELDDVNIKVNMLLDLLSQKIEKEI
jgi:hypothetical protein